MIFNANQIFHSSHEIEESVDIFKYEVIKSFVCKWCWASTINNVLKLTRKCTMTKDVRDTMITNNEPMRFF